MNWIYEKHRRNQELALLEATYRGQLHETACRLVGSFAPPYPVRSHPNKETNQEQPFTPVAAFHEHPNCSAQMTINLSVDIERIAGELLSLLEKAIPFQLKWRQTDITKQMITRHYRFMQFKPLRPDLLLVPTLDIDIVSQTYLLRPSMYRVDCLRLFRRIIDHSLITLASAPGNLFFFHISVTPPENPIIQTPMYQKMQ
ncbi:unnamed protein product [Didymodactylos carnosus]|uniref:Uncharacterized protein n=1 Tax=Didymodactylos carnosus TaxID=1234261 RepID=A0A814QH25_9BILA|nr:unnamed protein product [Didymodactylos carnosus]CAF1335667.1 unnamed protein product [Didymodactylos carnosus]CAF3884099.1 unnamed protein product [Didymodactylos carnosus]CAF4146994.1 unnamed protein product [Didymodactylos carnosus]